MTALPKIGRYQEVDAEFNMLGGEASNTAVALKHWGVEVVLAGNGLGKATFAGSLQQLLEKAGLDASLLPRDEPRMPSCDIYVTPDGERTMFGFGFRDMGPGTDLDLIPWKRGQWFTAEPNMGDPARRAVRRAILEGLNTYLMDFLRPDDPFAPNSWWQSSTDWFGAPGDIASNKVLLKDWSSRYRLNAILTDGANGNLFCEPDSQPIHLPAFPTPNLVDATGSGDAFRAGTLYGLHEGLTVGRSLAFGAAAGSLACEAIGGSRPANRLAIEARIAENPSVLEAYDSVAQWRCR